MLKEVMIQLYKKRQESIQIQMQLLANRLTKTENEYGEKCNQNLKLIEENNGLRNALYKLESVVNNYKNSDKTIPDLQEKIQNQENKISEQQEKIIDLEDKLLEMKKGNIEALQKKDIEIATITARWERTDEAKCYYKKLAENYQEMPNFKKLVENISDFKVPDVTGFIEKMTQIKEITQPITDSINNVEKIVSEINDKADDITRAAGFIADRTRNSRWLQKDYL